MYPAPMISAVIDGRISHAHQLPVSFGKKYSSGKATSRKGTMNAPSALVSGSTRSSRADVTCVFYHVRSGPFSTRSDGERAAERDQPGAGDRVGDPRTARSPTARRAVAVPAASSVTQQRLPTPTPVTSSAGASAAPAPLAAAKIAAQEAIVAGLEAVAATEVANARRGEAASSIVSRRAAPGTRRAGCALRARAGRRRRAARATSAAGRWRAATRRRPLRTPRTARPRARSRRRSRARRPSRRGASSEPGTATSARAAARRGTRVRNRL